MGWPKVMQLLQKLLETNTIRGYGIHGEVRSKKHFKKLLQRNPAPVAWLTPNDLLRPVDSDVAAAASDLGVSVVVLPRSPGVPEELASVHLAVVAGPESIAQEAAQYRWAAQRGFLPVVEVDRRESLSGGGCRAAEVLQHVRDMDLNVEQSRFLGALSALSRPAKSASGGSDPNVWGQQIEQMWSSLFALEDPLQNAISQAKLSDKFVPGVNAAVFDNLDAQKMRYAQNNFVTYQENFFDDLTWAAVREEARRLWKSDDLEPNCNLDGKDRLGGYVLDHKNHNSSLYDLIYGNEGFRRWVTAVNNNGEMWPSDFPIELREYGTGSKGMWCHSDLQMYTDATKDLEFAVTVDNPSGSEVIFFDKNEKKNIVHTRENSVMMVRSRAARHCVSPVSSNTRTILKFIYVGNYRKVSMFWEYATNQCGESNPNRQRLKARRQEVDRSEL